MFEHGETVTHQRYVPAGKDKDGYKIPASWVPTDIQGVGVDVPSTVEAEDGTVQRAVADLVLFLPPGFRCDSKDRFTVRGDPYEVVGVVEPIRNFFTGTMFHTEAKVRRTNG